RVALVLKHSQRVEHYQVAYMQVGSRGIEPQLHAQLVATLEACPKVIVDVDLHRSLVQALEEFSAQAWNLGNGRRTEVDLGVGGQQRLEEGDDRPVGRIHELDHEQRVVDRVADAHLHRVQLGAADRVGRRAQLVDHDVGEQ